MNLITCTACALAVTITFSMPASAVAPFSFDAASGPLPKDVVPLDYELKIVPDADTLTIAGTESVTVQLRRATATIVFNSLNEMLQDVRLDRSEERRVGKECRSR